MELLSGGEMLIRALADEGVEFLFGYPGGAVLHIYDAIFVRWAKRTLERAHWYGVVGIDEALLKVAPQPMQNA